MTKKVEVVLGSGANSAIHLNVGVDVQLSLLLGCDCSGFLQREADNPSLAHCTKDGDGHTSLCRDSCHSQGATDRTAKSSLDVHVEACFIDEHTPRELFHDSYPCLFQGSIWFTFEKLQKKSRVRLEQLLVATFSFFRRRNLLNLHRLQPIGLISLHCGSIKIGLDLLSGQPDIVLGSPDIDPRFSGSGSSSLVFQENQGEELVHLVLVVLSVQTSTYAFCSGNRIRIDLLRQIRLWLLCNNCLGCGLVALQKQINFAYVKYT
ncbi:hypothetical protein PHYBLDRAFT_165011 [Phycomyces blakesleeanus NRRL 1555(-)]|uniref:Uncharacterized protein n=1 Tax=Phycomyces blakesleeanus (strain ATCC 8743b / DSM 1359 / FGSC 10004 / NBRC 33097 / NRRL 1555) TaxID=763407 RepID=A0A163B3N2_PHYB8|nr:hypothetical protein PHYBLDRAFT_165011 [Phycomyces blakesleeanus NRRL 1555(-)]OAD78141.1 hypothetical protein PHYBLDRAFT_165011 [Phycomyces blakesleeanus NRRL 1555(-)]|eukprot:XP_018296181.1 hypothetical protein PHYBLDRAFT_165011 [Phycomyces blakesleeanus NRRL 1555(-)]